MKWSLARTISAAATAYRSVRAPRSRSLFHIARENAVEGCVRETYGAVVGMWKAGHVAGPGIARLLQRIARDEINHATLSWDIADWLAPRLSLRQIRSLLRAQAGVLAALQRRLRLRRTLTWSSTWACRIAPLP